MGKLTVRTVDSLVKAGTSGMTGDGEGLYFQISKTGGTSWVFRYKIAGRPRLMGLGRYPETSLAEAREKATECRKLTKAGIDPLDARDANRERQQLEEKKERQRIEQERLALGVAKARAVTFNTVATDYIAAHRAGWKNIKHAQQWENTLATYAEPTIGHLPTHDVTTAHLLQILQPVWTEKPETASRVRNRIELVLDAAKARGLREGENPARWRGHLDKLLPKRSKVRAVKSHAAMRWADLPAFMVELATLETSSARALELTILTACRTSEVLNAKWDEIDHETRTWTIPAERMKAGKAHRVPLSDAALAVLDALPRIERSAFLFPGMKPGKPLSNLAMTMTMRRMNMGHLTVHGFRSTFRDWAAERTQYPREVCEMALAHKIAEGAEAAYWRGDIFEKRRALMIDWAQYANTPPAANIIQGDFNRACAGSG